MGNVHRSCDCLRAPEWRLRRTRRVAVAPAPNLSTPQLPALDQRRVAFPHVAQANVVAIARARGENVKRYDFARSARGQSQRYDKRRDENSHALNAPEKVAP